MSHMPGSFRDTALSKTEQVPARMDFLFLQGEKGNTQEKKIVRVYIFIVACDENGCCRE